MTTRQGGVNFILDCISSLVVPQNATMQIMSTGQRNQSTDGGNHSSMGSDQSIMNSDANPHPKVSADNPGKFRLNTSIEYVEPKNAPGITSIKGGGSVNSDAAHEDMCKHPTKEYDPACRC